MTHARTSAKSVLLSLFLFTFCFPTLNAKTKLTAKEVIETFYKSYLTRPFDTKAKPSAPKLRFSKSFNELLKVNEKVCKEKAGTDICGWGADGDVYLNAQEYKPESYQKAGLTVNEITNGKVAVSFNVYPSIKDHKNSYIRTMTYLMLQEKSDWVVDDILYDNVSSARKSIQSEIDSYSKN